MKYGPRNWRSPPLPDDLVARTMSRNAEKEKRAKSKEANLKPPFDRERAPECIPARFVEQSNAKWEENSRSFPLTAAHEKTNGLSRFFRDK